MFCVSSGVLLDVFSTCWWYSAPEVDSVLLSCLWPRSSSTLAWYVLAGSSLRCTSPCVPFDCCRPGNGEVAQLMLQLLFLPEPGNYFHEPLVPCSHLYAVRALCRGFWEPSMTKSSSSSRARSGGVAWSLTPRRPATN